MRVCFQTREGGALYEGAAEVHVARRIEEVRPLLARIEHAAAEGAHAAGFVAYEAAPAFDRAFRCHPPGPLPLAAFGLYEAPKPAPPMGNAAQAPALEWRAAVDRAAYEAALETIRAHIASGDSYQVNYTFPLHAAHEGDAFPWFQQLCRAQGAGYGAYAELDGFQILSASPELFFRLEEGRIVTKPMKGTRPRGRWPAADRALRQALESSEKDRAENVMIVDLLRNDLGRIAEPGSVRVDRLFEIEQYHTVWQMTSTISARTGAGFGEIMGALFPSGSVTGAPKIETMKIIRRLEPHPRGVYCGTMGWLRPGGAAVFNVAIRTVTLDARTGRAVYPVGSGVTWYSQASHEYEECFDKAAVLSRAWPDFELFETLRLDGGVYYLLDHHLARMMDSARYFGFPVSEAALRERLEAHAAEHPAGSHRVRLLLAPHGACRAEGTPLDNRVVRTVALAADPIDSKEVFLYHKTTYRAMYENAMAQAPGVDDVILWNEQGRVTESTIGNVVVESGGRRLTPPVRDGLLNGTFRQALLDRGHIEEAPLRPEDLRQADALYVINSVREWMPVSLIEPE